MKSKLVKLKSVDDLMQSYRDCQGAKAIKKLIYPVQEIVEIEFDFKNLDYTCG